jgi:hypothetical protein
VNTAPFAIGLLANETMDIFLVERFSIGVRYRPLCKKYFSDHEIILAHLNMVLKVIINV